MKCRVAVVVVAAWTGVVSSLGAEDSPPLTSRLPEVVVTSARLPAEQVALEKYPAHVTVLTTNELVATPAFTLPEMLRQEVGVAPFDTVGFGQFANVSLRGFGEKGGNLFLVDGVRVNDAGSSDFPFLWNTVPLANIERIEVIRGGGSTTYGEGAIGGVVNIVTKRPTDRLFSGEATAVGGNLGYYAGHLGLRGRTNWLEYAVSGDRQEWSGWREASSYRSWTASAKPGVTTPVGRFTLGYYFHDETSLNPGPLTETEWQADPRQAGSTIFSYTNVVHRATLDYEKCFDSGWAVLGKFYGQVYDSDNRGYANVHVEQPNYGTTWQASHHGELFGRPNILTLGVEAIQQDFSSTLEAPAYGYEAATIADNWTVSAFVQEAWTVFSRLTVTAGLRYDHRQWNIDVTDNYGTDLRADRRADVWSPKLGLTYEFAEKISGWVTGSRSYRLPSGYDIGTPASTYDALFYANPEVEPVVANTVEAGLRVNRWRWLRGSVAGFYSHVTDDIVYNPFTYQNENFDGNRAGGELTLRSQPVEWADFYYTAAYTDSRFDGGTFDGNRLPLVPEWQLTGGLNVRPWRGLQFTWEVVYINGQVASNDLANEFAPNEYVVCNAKARYTWRWLTTFVSVNNIFDQLYETFPATKTDFFGNQSREYNPAAGINFQAGATVAF